MFFIGVLPSHNLVSSLSWSRFDLTTLPNSVKGVHFLVFLLACCLHKLGISVNGDLLVCSIMVRMINNDNKFLKIN